MSELKPETFNKMMAFSRAEDARIEYVLEFGLGIPLSSAVTAEITGYDIESGDPVWTYKDVMK